MGDERRVLCSENQGLADYVLQKKREHADKPKGLSENLERTYVKAYRNVCDAKDPISTLKDLSQIKGFGKRMLKLTKAYFETGAGSSEQEDLPENSAARKAKEKKQYIPRRNSASYALLITLHRGTPNKKDFMRKQELIDAADASGLSLVPIAAEKGKGKAGLGHSKREWYSGWSCMGTLVQNELVMKFSNPAKYRLTDEGREVANECIRRSGPSSSRNILSDDETDLAQPYAYPKDSAGASGAKTCQVDILSDDEMDLAEPYSYLKSKADSAGPSRAKTCQVDILSDDETDLAQPYAYPKDSAGPSRAQNCQVDLEGSRAKKFRTCNDGYTLNPCLSGSSHALKACSSSLQMEPKKLQMFHAFLLLHLEKRLRKHMRWSCYCHREQFATKGEKVENICSGFKIKIEIRRLPVGDCLWIARHKSLGTEYVLDFIVERKNVDDMSSSIQDGRYKDQKLRIQRSGLKKLMYILEGDPNQSGSGGRIKTACFTTEVLEGFDVIRTNGLGETLRKYGYLTKSVHQYYKSQVNDEQSKVSALCPTFDSFVKRCQDLDKKTVGDVFAMQLMQVPQVTEEIAVAVLDMYPTLLSLASAYSHLEGNVWEQEEMLRNRSNNVICGTASKNIFKLVWSE